MKRYIYNQSENSKTSQALITPAQLIFYGSCAVLSIMFICGIILTFLPESICDPARASECAYDILSASFRVAALSAVFITLAAALDIRYPRDND